MASNLTIFQKLHGSYTLIKFVEKHFLYGVLPCDLAHIYERRLDDSDDD